MNSGLALTLPHGQEFRVAILIVPILRLLNKVCFDSLFRDAPGVSLEWIVSQFLVGRGY
jgi:hypothetical protein